MKKPLYIYTRVSSSSQIENYSLENQKEQGIKKAQELNLEYKVLIEPGKSATHRDFNNRPVMKELISLINNGHVESVFVVDDTRLARNEYASAIIRDAMLRNNVILYTTNAIIDFQNPQDTFISGVLNLAKINSEQERKQKIISGLEKAYKDGKCTGAITPYGYTKDEKGYLIIDEPEKKVYLVVVKMCLKGFSTNKIAKELNVQNIPTKCKKVLKNGSHKKDKYNYKLTKIDRDSYKWSSGVIYGILTNPIYYGQRRFKGTFIATTPIIDENTWLKMQTQIKNNRTHSITNKKKYDYLLRGLVKCGKCGSNYYGRIKANRGERVYKCSSTRSDINATNCGNRGVNIDKLDKLVWEVFCNTFSHNSKLRKEFKTKFLKNKDSKSEFRKIKNKLLVNKRNLNDNADAKEQTMKMYQKKHINDAELDTEMLKIKNENDNLIQQQKDLKNNLSVYSEEKSIYSWLNHFNEWVNNIKHSSDFMAKKDILMTFIEQINVLYLKDEKVHVIEIVFKIPFETDDQVYTLDGMSLKTGDNIYCPSFFISTFEVSQNRLIISFTSKIMLKMNFKKAASYSEEMVTINF